MKFVSLGVAPKVVVILKNENACRIAEAFAKEMGRGKPADSTTHHDQIVFLVKFDWLAGFAPKSAIPQTVRCLKRSGMAPAHACRYGGIVARPILWLRHLSLAGHGVTRNHGGAHQHGCPIHEITPGNLPAHPEFPVACAKAHLHRRSLPLALAACSVGPLNPTLIMQTYKKCCFASRRNRPGGSTTSGLLQEKR